MRLPWLADVARQADLPVHEVAGWRGRGRDLAAVRGIVVHDTVTTASWGVAREDALLRDGHGNLPGPLAQCGVARDGSVRVIADGRANHNGYGRWGNDSIGIEVYAAGGLKGREEPWNAAQYATVVALCAALVARLNVPVLGHRETDPNRKVDPYGIDLRRLRDDIDTAATPTAPAPDPIGDDMLVRIDDGQTVYHVVGPALVPLTSAVQAEVLAGTGWRDKVKTLTPREAGVFYVAQGRAGARGGPVETADRLQQGLDASNSTPLGAGRWLAPVIRWARDQGADLDKHTAS